MAHEKESYGTAKKKKEKPKKKKTSRYRKRPAGSTYRDRLSRVPSMFGD